MCKKHLQNDQSSDRVLSVALKEHTQTGLRKSSEVAIEPNLTTETCRLAKTEQFI